jgi:ATPase subunit of ABC transporter with duplicated ATPase domains
MSTESPTTETTPDDLRDRYAEALYTSSGVMIPWSMLLTDPDFRSVLEQFRRDADAVMEVRDEDMERLREDDEIAQQVIADLNTRIVKAERRAGRAEQELERERRLYDREEKARIAAENKLHAVAALRVFRNEDGKKFVFVDDLYEALEGGEGR